MDGDFKDFLAFRRMVAPILLQILFWILVVLNIVGSIYLMTRGSYFVLLGLVNLIVETLIIRVIFELLIIFFRMNETLTEIKKNTGGAFAPLTPAYAPVGGSAPSKPMMGTPAVAPQPVQRTCPNCGAGVDEGLSFCSQCGQPMNQ
jgi:hypothetical protein